MWKFLIALLFTIQMSGQVLRADNALIKHITVNTLMINSKLFKDPPFKQPVVFIKYSPLYPGFVGITREITGGFYIVDLSPAYDEDTLEKTLMHELVHVHQMYSGDLKMIRGGFLWKGRKYPFSTEYKTRPWEVAAEREVDLICNY